MPEQVIQFEGTEHHFPDDFSPADIARALKAAHPQPTGAGPTRHNDSAGHPAAAVPQPGLPEEGVMGALFTPARGAAQMVHGAGRLTAPGEGETRGGIADLLHGFLNVLSPYLPQSAAEVGLGKTVAGLVGSKVGGAVGDTVADLTGASPGARQLAGEGGSLVGAGVGAVGGPPVARTIGNATVGPGTPQILSGVGQAALGLGAEGLGAITGHPIVGALPAGGAILRGGYNVVKGVGANLDAAAAARADTASLARDAELRGFTPGQQAAITTPVGGQRQPAAPTPPPLPAPWIDDVINNKQTVPGSQPTPAAPPVPAPAPEISGRPTVGRFDPDQYGNRRVVPPVEVGGGHIPDFKSPFPGTAEEFAARIAASQPQAQAPSTVSDPAAFAQLPPQIQAAIVKGAQNRQGAVPPPAMAPRSPEYYGVQAATHPAPTVRAQPSTPPPVGPTTAPVGPTGQHPVYGQPLTPLDSDAVQAIAYHPESQTARVQIKGRDYTLPMTPEMHGRILAASADPQQSVGAIWNKEVRPGLETASGVLRPKAPAAALPETAAPTLEQRLAASPDAAMLRTEVQRRAAAQRLGPADLEAVVRQAAADINTGRAAGGNAAGTIPDWVVRDVLKGLQR